MAIVKKLCHSWRLLIIPFAVLFCYLLAVRIVNSIDYHNNDFFTFWLAGHMVTQNGNPYSPEQWVAGHGQFGVTWIPNQVYVYPLPLSLLFAPLGLLPLYQSYILWVALSQGMILASVFLLCPPERELNTRYLFLSFLVGVIFFRPTTLTLVTGQLSAWLLFLLVCTAQLWTKEKWEWGSFLLPLLLLKPNLGVPIVLLLAAWLLFTKRYRSLVSIGLGGTLLLAASMIKNPAWPLEYLSIGNAKLSHDFGFSPTVWGLANLACGHDHTCSLVVGGTMAALFVFTTFWLLARRRRSLTPLWVISLSVTVSLLVTPYSWTYDQLLLLIPIAAVTFALGQRRHGFLPAALLFLGIDILSVFLLFFNTTLDVEILNAIIPLAMLVLVIWMLLRKNKPQGSETLPIQAGIR